MSDLDSNDLRRNIYRRPIMFVFDTSNLSKKQIAALNKGLQSFHSKMEELVNENLLYKGVEVAVVTCGRNITAEQGFTFIEEWNPPSLDVESKCSFGKAILKTFKLLEDRFLEYHNNNVGFKKAEIYFFNSSSLIEMNQGDVLWTEVKNNLDVKTNTDESVKFILAGASESDFETLSQFVPYTEIPLLKLKEQKNMFKDYFEFIAERPRDDISSAANISLENMIEDSDSLSFIE